MNFAAEPATPPETGLGLKLTPDTRLLVLGGYGVRNVGDEAILAGLLNQLPEVRSVCVVSRDPRQTEALHQVKAVSPAGALRALVGSDALIVGGGGLFSSDTGPLGQFIPLFCRIALWRGVRVAFHGIGVYSSTPAKLMGELQRLAPKLESFTVRDRVSVQILQAHGITTLQHPDLSNSMLPAPAERARELILSAGIDPTRPVVGLCLTSINKALERQLQSSVPELCRSLPEVQFCYVPISQHPTNARHNDMRLATWLQEHEPSLRTLQGFHHPAVLLSLFGELSAAVCVRYHSYLFAERAGIPLVGIPYAEKCASWLQEHGMIPFDFTGASLAMAVQSALDGPNAPLTNAERIAA